MAIRDLFLLDPNVVFLNHGSFGATPREVFQAYQDWQLECERQPVAFFARHYYEFIATARADLAQFINCDPQDVVYVPNATYGLNEIGKSITLDEGDEVLASDQEYGAFENMWPVLCRRAGAIYKRQRVTLPITSAEEVVEQIWSGVTERTKVLFISHITSPTAIILPIAELVRRARELGIISIIDGAHGPGQVPLDLKALDPDFYSANCHKWMMSPKGSGFLYARRDMQAMLDPLVVSSEARRERGEASAFLLEHDYQGTRDIAAYLATPDAIRFMERHDWDTVRAECHQILRYAREAISDLTGLAPLTPDSPDWYVQLAAFLLPPVNTLELKRRLLEEFNVEVPLTGTPDGRPAIRVSVQGYVTRDDIDALVTALKVLLPQVAA